MMKFRAFFSLPVATDVRFSESGEVTQFLIEDKWVEVGGYSVRYDTPRHGGGGQPHAHVYDRKDRKLGAVNQDGTASHNSKFRLTKAVANNMKQHNYKIRADRIVEIFELDGEPILLLG